MMGNELLAFLNHILSLAMGRYSILAAIGGTIIGFFVIRLNFTTNYLNLTLRILLNINFFVITIIAASYLFFASYFDAVESTIAILGVMFSNGAPIYPELPNHSFHGLLYGPGLSLIQAVFQKSGLQIILASKIPGVSVFIISVGLLFFLLKDLFARAYLLYLIPFRILLYWPRAEPFFLLAVVLSLLTLSRSKTYKAIFFTGCMAGFASSLKLHAALYVLAALFVVLPLNKITVNVLIAFFTGLIGTLVLLFLPSQISVTNYWAVMELSSQHGLSFRNFRENILYLVGLCLPIVYLLISNPKIITKYSFAVGALALIEIVVSVIASKHGAGAHHLIPFIPINAWLIQNILKDPEVSKPSLDPFKFGLLAVGMAGVLHSTGIVEEMLRTNKFNRALTAEVVQLGNDYPEIILGVSDDAHWTYAFPRPVLEAKGYHQIDFPTYLDLDASGVTDALFASAMESCKLPYIAMPRDGAPFSMINPYTQRPLLSDRVREAFKTNYFIHAQKEYYSVYKCMN